MAGESHYRLFEVDRHGRGIELPRLYDDVQTAVDAADYMVRALESFPHRRPQYVKVFDVWTGEVMATSRPDQDRDPNLCPTCGQPRDPFSSAPVSPASPPDTGAGDL